MQSFFCGSLNDLQSHVVFMHGRKYYKIVALCCCVFFNIQFFAAQDDEQIQIDSLKKVNTSLSISPQLIDNYNMLAYHYGALDADSSLYYSTKAGILAKDIDYPYGFGIAHYSQARVWVEKSDFKTALTNYSIALSSFEDEKDSINMLSCYKGMSYVSSYNASHLASIDYNLKALDIAEKLNDSISLSVIYNNIGAIYKGLDNYELSLFYFTKSIQYKKKESRTSDLAISYANVIVLKVENDKVGDAGYEMQMLMELLPSVNNDYVYAYLYLAISSYYKEINDFDSAEDYIAKAKAICLKNNFTHV